MGFKSQGGGTHQSKTMMLHDLSIILAEKLRGSPSELILETNILSKPSLRSRNAALYRLRQLYGIDAADPICAALAALWAKETLGRPVLALACALARDPSFRGSASVALDATLGEQVRWPSFAQAFEARNPGRLSEKMLKSLSQNAASSWTQAGFLEGATKKLRVRPVATPITAAYAALLASLAGFGGVRLLSSRWLDLVDRLPEDRLALLRQAEGMGLARVRMAGDVLEIDVRTPMAQTLGIPALVDR